VSGRPAAFLDRDGTLNELVPDPSGIPESPLRPADVRLIEGAAVAARALAQAGFALVCVSNQPAAAKGKVSIEQLHAVHERVLELLREQGVHLDAYRLCLHHPQAVVPELAGACACRKPAPGMLLDAAEELHLDLASSWMLGDTDSDVIAGHAAGCRVVLIEHPGSAHKRAAEASPDRVASSLADGVAQLLDRRSR
jgi:D-glycero-D-manno-heptose 1,7-bisphosphate phosphatase